MSGLGEAVKAVFFKLAQEQGVDIGAPAQQTCDIHGEYIAHSINGEDAPCPTCHLQQTKVERAKQSFELSPEQAQDKMLASGFGKGTLDRALNYKASEQEQADEQKHINHPTANIILSGHVGRGKTCSGYRIAHALALNGYSVGTVKAGELVDIAWDDKARYDKLKKVQFLLIDDIGSGVKASTSIQHFSGVLEALIDYRYDNQLRTAFTTNLSADKFGEWLGARALSRLKDKDVGCFLRSFKGEDMRNEGVSQ